MTACLKEIFKNGSLRFIDMQKLHIDKLIARIKNDYECLEYPSND